MWPLSKPFLYSWWGKNRVSCPPLPVICSLLSTLHYLSCFSHTACARISVHGFLFMLIFPSWDRNRCFPSILGGAHAEAAGQIWGDGSLRSVFSWQGAVGYSAWLELSSSWGRPRAPWPPVLSSAHMHTHPPQDQGRRRPDDGGAGFSLRLRETCCPLPMGFICPTQDHKGRAAKHSKLHRLGWKVPDHKHTQTHTEHHSHCHFHSTSFYILQTVHPGTF